MEIFFSMKLDQIVEHESSLRYLQKISKVSLPRRPPPSRAEVDPAMEKPSTPIMLLKIEVPTRPPPYRRCYRRRLQKQCNWLLREGAFPSTQNRACLEEPRVIYSSLAARSLSAVEWSRRCQVRRTMWFSTRGMVYRSSKLPTIKLVSFGRSTSESSRFLLIPSDSFR